MAQSMSADQRSLRARVAAHALHAQGKTNTGPARAAMQAKFENQVDPDGILPTAERARRAEHARKAYFAALALKSSIARSKAKRLLAEAEVAEAEISSDAA
ncbi:hypothetical protein ACIBCH_36700 [Amycolatopsis thailandensis]|uniref:hypothetical protein n=1 Tax=Amycolatopsis thailandensis TaxID=589330 RepID=UPI0037B5E58B